MQLRLALLPLLVAGAISAQSTLPITMTSGAGQYIWVPAPTTNPVGFFFDVTVINPVTFQGVSFPTYTPLGQSLILEMYTTNTGITTYVGNETIPANWTMQATGTTTVVGAPAANYVCLTQGVTLQPGNYGMALLVRNANNLFSNLGPQVFSNADLSVTAGAVSAAAFTTAPSAYGTQTFYFNGTLHYAPGVAAHSCASKTTTGRGCNSTAGSFYQEWTSNAAMSAALNGRKLSLLFNGVGYTLTQGLATVNYIAPTAAATTLPTNNNGEATVPLATGSFNYPGGSTNQFVIATDGHISPLSNLPFPGQNYNFMPFGAGVLNAANPIWAVCWHNFNTTELNSGLIKWEQVGNLFIVTWDNVESLPGNNTAQTPNPCTFQAQFDLTTGDVHYVYQSMTTIGGSQSYDGTVIGYSPGGPSPDVGPIDVTTLVALPLASTEVQPLTLRASAAPVLGTNVDFVTSNETIPNLGVNFISIAALPAPVDLGILGAPGCFAHVDTSVAVGNLISNLGAPLPSMTVTLPIPLNPALSGFQLASQSVWLDPAANAFGILTSNAVRMTLGLFAL